MGSTAPIRIQTIADLAGVKAYTNSVAAMDATNQKAAASFKEAGAASVDFESQVAGLKAQIDALNEKLEQTGAKASGGLREARGAARLLGEEVGIHLNRELAGVLARSETLGPLLAKAFSIVAIGAFIQLAAQLPEMLDKATDALAGWGEAQKKAYGEAISANAEAIKQNLELANAQEEQAQIGIVGEKKKVEALKDTTDEMKRNADASAQALQAARSIEEQIEKLKSQQKSNFLSMEPILAAANYRALGKDIDSLTDSMQNQLKLANELAGELPKLQVKKQGISLEGSADSASDARAAAEASLEAEKEVWQARIANGEDSAKIALADQKISLDAEVGTLEQMENRKLEIEKQFLEARRDQLKAETATTGKDNTPEIERVNAQIEAAEVSHDVKMRALDEQLAAADRKQTEETVQLKLEAQKQLVEDTQRLNEEALAKTIEDQQKQREAVFTAAQEQLQATTDADNKRLESFLRTESTMLATHHTTLAQLKAADNEALDDWYNKQSEALEKALRTASLTFGQESRQYGELKKQEIDLDEQYRAKQQEIQNQVAQDYQRMIQKQEQSLRQYTELFNSTLNQWITGQKTFGQAFAEMWKKMADNMIQNLIRMGEQEILFGVIEKEQNNQSIISHAHDAAVKSYDWASGWGGPVAGAIAAAVALAGALAFGSYEEGGIVPANLHPGEMVLPAGISSFVQNAAANASGEGGKGGGDTHVHLGVSAVDGASVQKMFQQHSGTIGRQIRSMVRSSSGRSVKGRP